MTRNEHNSKWNVNRQPTEIVQCHTIGYGELDHYDPKCSKCWLGHQHTWAQHDKSLGRTA